MHFALSEEQLALQEAARGFLAELPGALSMTEQQDVYDAAAWARIVEEQGWPAILVPESAGGWGFGLLEMAVVFEETGRTLTPSPLFATVALAVNTLVTCGSADQQTRWLGELAAGATGTLAHGGEVVASPAGDDWILSGIVHRVVDGHSADVVVVETDQGLFVVPGEACERAKRPSLDTSRPVADVRLDGVRVRAADKLLSDDLAPALRRGAVLLAAESVGAADACLETSVDYAKVRVQYGKAIGSFQAIQHILADVCLDVEQARAATWYAATALDQGTDDAHLAAHTAKSLAGDALFHAAAQSVQVHGGVGFTWECVAHMFFKRARAAQQLLGHPRAHRTAVADALLGGA